MRPRHVSKGTLLMRIRKNIKETSTDKFHLIFEGKIKEMLRLMSVLTMP